jgi:hypothetical protein
MGCARVVVGAGGVWPHPKKNQKGIKQFFSTVCFCRETENYLFSLSFGKSELLNKLNFVILNICLIVQGTHLYAFPLLSCSLYMFAIRVQYDYPPYDCSLYTQPEFLTF